KLRCVRVDALGCCGTRNDLAVNDAYVILLYPAALVNNFDYMNTIACLGSYEVTLIVAEACVIERKNHHSFAEPAQVTAYLCGTLIIGVGHCQYIEVNA